MSYATEHGVLNAKWNAALEAQNAAAEQQRPSVLYRPTLFVDGNQYCALYGADIQSGVAGFGDSPALAMADFDTEWKKKFNQPMHRTATRR